MPTDPPQPSNIAYMGIELPIRRHVNPNHLSDLSPKDFCRQVHAFILCLSITDPKFAYSVHDLGTIGHSFGIRPPAISLMVHILQNLRVIEYQDHPLVGRIIRWNYATKKPVKEVSRSVIKQIITAFAAQGGPNQ